LSANRAAKSTMRRLRAGRPAMTAHRPATGDRLAGWFRASPLPKLIWLARQGYLGLARPFRLGVRIIVLDGDERVLLVRHSYRPGWHLPGGGVDKWETVADAAIREAREEAGVAIASLDGPLGIYANFGIGYCDHVVLFAARDWRPQPTRSIEIAERRFFRLSDCPDDASSPTKRRLAEFRGEAPRDPHW
jgi:8-oxo-dGTP pyrophosphatase MutT (NUDIX family)